MSFDPEKLHPSSQFDPRKLEQLKETSVFDPTQLHPKFDPAKLHPEPTAVATTPDTFEPHPLLPTREQVIQAKIEKDEPLPEIPFAKMQSAKDVGNSLKVLGKGIALLPSQVKAKYLTSLQGIKGAGTTDDSERQKGIKIAEEKMDEFMENVAKDYGEGKLISEIAQLPQNLAFSVVSMGAGAVTGVPIALIPVPGARVAGWTLGTAASGAVAYRMAGYEIMQELLEFSNEEKIKNTGQGLTKEEEKILKDRYEWLASKHGLWEAIPEALSNLAFVSILTKPVSKVLSKTLIGRISMKLGAMYGEEFATETITEKAQSPIREEIGLPGGGEIGWWEAFKRIAPQTFLLTTVMGGAGGVIVNTAKLTQSLKKEIRENHPAYNKLKENLEGLKEKAPEIEKDISKEEPTPSGMVFDKETQKFEMKEEEPTQVKPDVVILPTEPTKVVEGKPSVIEGESALERIEEEKLYKKDYKKTISDLTKWTANLPETLKDKAVVFGSVSEEKLYEKSYLARKTGKKKTDIDIFLKDYDALGDVRGGIQTVDIEDIKEYGLEPFAKGKMEASVLIPLPNRLGFDQLLPTEEFTKKVNAYIGDKIVDLFVDIDGVLHQYHYDHDVKQPVFSPVGLFDKGEYDETFAEIIRNTAIKSGKSLSELITQKPVREKAEEKLFKTEKEEAKLPTEPTKVVEGKPSAIEEKLKPVWELTQKQFKEEGKWAEYPETVEEPAVYKRIAKQESEQARDLVYELHLKDIPTIDTHIKRNEVIIHLLPNSSKQAMVQEFLKKHKGSLWKENKYGDYIAIPETQKPEMRERHGAKTTLEKIEEKPTTEFELIGKPRKGKFTPAERLKMEGKVPTTQNQIKQAHIIAKKKALYTPEGKATPQYKRLARIMTGKKSMLEMTQDEANRFIYALKSMAESHYKGGKLVPASLSRTKAIVTKDYYKRIKFRTPTIMELFTSQDYYAEALGVKYLTEKLEIGKQNFDLTYRKMANDVERMGAEINKIGKTSKKEIATSKLKNIPTKAISEMRDLLDKYEEAPESIIEIKKGKWGKLMEFDTRKIELFNWFRNLNRTLLKQENEVRGKMGIEPIKYRKAYVRHTADVMAQEMLAGLHPFPEGLKYWSQKIVGKKIFNPMEMHRQLANDLENLWTKDLIHATKSMLWTGLKEIHLSQPLKFFNEQLGAVSKDIQVYKNLSPEEKEIYNARIVIPASTKKWLLGYINNVIKGQETWQDEKVNRLVNNEGVKGLLNKALAPFGRTVSRKPITNLFQTAGRLTIHGVMGPLRPRQLIRNKFQLTQNLGLYTLKSNLKGFFPANKQMKELLDKSLFLKGYTGMEDLPVSILSKLEKLNLAGFQWTAKTNAYQSMKTAYWDTYELITNPKHKKLGWSDSKRTYKEAKDFLYPSEKEKLLKEMEFGAGVTQYSYISMGMPQIFRYKSAIPFTRLQSWWMNHFFKFNREMVYRAFKGKTTYGNTLPWSRRLGCFRYLIIGGAILNTMGYTASFLFGAAPSGFPPTAQLMLGLYNYFLALYNGDERKKKNAKWKMLNALRTFIPGELARRDLVALWTGKKNLQQFFFYKKLGWQMPWERKKKPKPTKSFKVDTGTADLKIDL